VCGALLKAALDLNVASAFLNAMSAVLSDFNLPLNEHTPDVLAFRDVGRLISSANCPSKDANKLVERYNQLCIRVGYIDRNTVSLNAILMNPTEFRLTKNAFVRLSGQCYLLSPPTLMY
jgi:hypothetical protein